MSGAKGKTVLAQGAEFAKDEKLPLGFWWRDPDRLLKRVMALAESDPKVRRLLRAKVGKLAGRDEEFRSELVKDLNALVTGNGRPKKYPLWFEMLVFAEINVFRDKLYPNLDEAYAASASIHQNLFPGITDAAIRGIYSRMRKHKSR